MSIPPKTNTSSSKSLLASILWQSRSRWQLLGAAIGAGLGFFLLLAALQVYFDLQGFLGGTGSDQCVQINKRVNLINTLGTRSGFTKEEIAELEEQNFIESLGAFQSNDFKVGAGSNAFGFYTELFFESVPSEFIDLELPSFQWKDGDGEVPIILSRDYLALYNFGFAPSQGLPQFTPNTIKRVPIDLVIRGNGTRTNATGRIVGFSDRINSILVPEEFLVWANQKFGTGVEATPSRLILKVDNPLGKPFRDFLKERNYELSTGRLVGGEVIATIQLIIVILAFIGFLIAILSLLVVNLNYRLLIAEASADIRRLFELGYTRSELGSILNRSSIKWYGLSWLAAVVVLSLLHLFLARILTAQGMELEGILHPVVWIAALGLALGFFFFQGRNIKATLNALFT
ncbi:MAG: hypothetical protein KDC34_14260 [Saprospiraceae bacterium]|nr:hypothetical protein [Saprospiraceae bacterium]